MVRYVTRVEKEKTRRKNNLRYYHSDCRRRRHAPNRCAVYPQYVNVMIEFKKNYFLNNILSSKINSRSTSIK